MNETLRPIRKQHTGAGMISSGNNLQTVAPLNEVGKVDPRLAFLARAAARFELVHIGEMDIDEAFDGLVVCLHCSCSRDLVEKWEREDARRPTLISKRNF